MSIPTNIRRYINDTATVFYPAQHVNDAANSIHLRNWINARPVLTTATMTTTAGQTTIGLGTVMVPKYVMSSNVERGFTDYTVLERVDRVWSTATGTPEWFVKYDAETIRLYPTADGIYELKLVGLAWPAEIGTATSIYPGDYDASVEYGAAGRLLEFIRPDLTQIHTAESRNCFQRFLVTMRNKLQHQVRRLRPANKFNRKQHGNI